MTNNIFEESGFEFDFSNSINAYRFDNVSYYGLKLIDFVVETQNEYLFVEVKNPDNKKSRPESRKQFLEEIKNDEYREYCLKMAIKFKDSILKELAMSKTFSKPIIYILLLEYSQFDARQRSKIYERINGHIPAFKETAYTAIKNIKFALHNKDEFIKNYAFNVTEI